MSNRQKNVILNLALLRLDLSEVAQNFITDRGRPYTDTSRVVPPGVLKSSQSIGDDPNLCAWH